MSRDDHELFWPQIVRAPRVDVTVVCGPPAAGKSVYVAAKAAVCDTVIDLDEIVKEIGGESRTDDWGIRERALKLRNARLQKLADARAPAWFITTAPGGFAREKWARMLRTSKVLVFLTCKAECLRRIHKDVARASQVEVQTRIVERWWAVYYPSKVDTNRDCSCDSCSGL